MRSRLTSLGRRLSKDYIAYHVTGHLLDDVVLAAGGVERSLSSLRAAHRELTAYVAGNALLATPGVPTGVGHEAAVEAWYAFADMLSWSRTIIERLDRRASDSKKFPRQGLIQGIKPKRLKERCEAILADLRNGPVGHSRILANFILHTALLQNPFSGVRLEESGSITLPIPDLPAAPVSHWYLLTWNDDRDGFAYAEKLWQAVEASIDNLLSAFEGAVPRRMRRLAPMA